MTLPKNVKASLPALFLLGFGVTALSAAQFMPVDGGRVAVLAPDGDPLQVVVAAGGTALGGAPGVVYAASAEPGFIDRLYRSGAWLVLRYDGAAGCLQANLEENTYERG